MALACRYKNISCLCSWAILTCCIAAPVCFAGELEDQLGIPTPVSGGDFTFDFDRYYPDDNITSWRHKGYMTTDMYQYRWDPSISAMSIKKFENQTPFLTEDAVMRTPGWAHWSLPEIVTIGDTDYYHVVLGSLDDGFIQETYIEAGYRIDNLARGVFGTPVNFVDSRGDRYSWAKNSGGVNWGSASGGDYDIKLARPFGPSWGYDTGVGEVWQGGNAKDPLGDYAVSGNGSAAPKKVLVRQILVDGTGEFVQQFLKDTFTGKPRITQNIVNSQIEVKTDIDMTSQNYDSMAAGAVVTSTLLLKGNDSPPDPDWDMHSDSQRYYYNAGQFEYLAGSGNGGAEGWYDYADVDYDHTSIDWVGYFDHHDPTGNPWGYPEEKP